MRLPRMRGDRPVYELFDTFSRPATPHARGSTGKYAGLAGGLSGYPACAGIDQFQCMHLYEVRQLPPHTRGST